MPERSKSSSVTATYQPRSSSPTTLARGTRTLSNSTWLNSCPPAILIIGRTDTPGDFISTSTKLIPRCFGASGSVRVSSIIQSARCASVVQILPPLITRSSPSRTARVLRDAKSEPDSGSLYPWHHCTSPRATGGRCVRFCSSEPWIISVGPSIRTPKISRPGARR